MKNIKAQTPAEGILLSNDWGYSKSYSIRCECGDETHSHNLWVEAEDHGITVTIYTDQTTDYWTNTVDPRYDIDNELTQWYNWFWTGLWNGLCTRIRLTKDIWIHGKCNYQSTVILSKQSATNYAETLKKAVIDVETFQNKP